MKFKEGKLYRVVKDVNCPGCIGCILKYKGINRGHSKSKAIKPASLACSGINCLIFHYAIDYPDETKMVEYIDMVKFCKKLRNEILQNRK